ncbi:MAG: tRNA lysidine(34) synthetase TilS [Candidatus Sumerlaeota bacterium]|nr:tRNA lysidine(34) synthetase TilS [Candidatus Sumerlaeota bacterium]
MKRALSCPHSNDILAPALETIRRERMLAPGDRVIAAVSGGADSVAMLHLLTRLARETPLKLSIRVVHVDHGLRGRASKADARFVERLVARMGWPCSIIPLRLSHVAPREKRNASPESEWRDARRAALAREARRRRIRIIALGHTRDDLAETVLMRLIRGSGSHGLAAFGPRAEREGVAMIRPLYDVTRRQVEAYCRDRKLRWRTDASNADIEHLRNHVRLVLLPLLEKEFNPSIRDALARAAESLRAEDEFLEEMAEAVVRGQGAKGRGQGSGVRGQSSIANRQSSIVNRQSPIATRQSSIANRPSSIVHLKFLSSLPLALLRRVLRRWIMTVSGDDYPPSFNEVERLAALISEGHTGARFELRRRWAFIRERAKIRVETL